MQPEKNCLHRQQHRKKLFVLKIFLSPPPHLQKNNGPSLTERGTRHQNILSKRKQWHLLDCVISESRGGTPLYGLNGDVRPDRVWFSEDFVLNGVLISSILVLNRVSLQDLMYSLTTEPSQKAKFLPVCQCSAY